MVALMLMAFFEMGCGKHAPLPTVDAVDLERYAGQWYEIARLPNSFEAGLKCVTATYTVLENGKVGVTNRGINEETGEVTEYRPRQRDGAYIAVLPPCITYRIEYFANAEMVHKDFVNVPCESAYSEIEKEVFLLPVNLADDGSEQPIVPPVVPPVVPKEGDIVGETPKEMDSSDKVGVIANADNAYYQRYFVYDMGEWTDKKVEETFAKFTDGVSNLIAIKGKAKILIESSASKVPSSRFKNNQELSAFRNKQAKDEITKALVAKGYKEGVDFTFQEGRKLVSGPDYKNDAQKNKHIYEQFQYIKVWAE
jgi:hypothetical protein